MWLWRFRCLASVGTRPTIALAVGKSSFPRRKPYCCLRSRGSGEIAPLDTTSFAAVTLGL
jgi:hypothetical protein